MKVELDLVVPAKCGAYPLSPDVRKIVFDGDVVFDRKAGKLTFTAVAGEAGEHTHEQDEIDGLEDALAGKATSDHDHNGVYEPADAALQAHVAAAHAPSNAQKNSDITKAEIEAKLTGEVSSHSHAADPGGGVTLAEVIEALYPVGALKFSADNVNPGTYLSDTTWEQWGPGRVLVCADANDTDFDTAEEERGAKTVAAVGTVSQPTFSGDAFSGVINHTHPVNVTDPQHAHVENSNNATTGGLRGWGAADTSTSTSTATGYSTAAASTGITATTSNPAGGVASITPTGTVSQPTFTGTATSVVQPSIVGFMWKRTA